MKYPQTTINGQTPRSPGVSAARFDKLISVDKALEKAGITPRTSKP